MSSELFWSSDPMPLEKKGGYVFVVVESCCNHFAGVFANEQDAKNLVEECGEGFYYDRFLI
jgi:hypothetical protein